jgi:Ca2+-binding RTX toxin-like protein
VAIGITGADDQTVRITNSGTIVGSPFIDPAIKVALLDFAGGKTVITNTGTIDGLLALGNGNDTVTNVGGTIRGTMAGNDGSDVFVLGLGSETVNGGGGTDLLDFSGGAGLRVVLNDLDGSGNSGRAKDDHYTGIERVIGSATGADTLVGDNAANRLSGLGGADELRGGIGADRLIGGEGVDTLKGGTGGDFFRFNARGEGGDAIVDFEVSGNDVIEIDASSFGGGLTAGQSLDGILQFGEFDTAAFAATRFVFNITNAKLWFDSNGSASGGRVLVADLQDSAAASFDADDILLI